MTTITTPGPTANPLTGVITDPTATYPAGLGPTYLPLPPVPPLPVPPSTGPRPPWYQQKRYAFPLILLVLLVIIGLFGSRSTAAPAPTATPTTVTTPAERAPAEQAPAPAPAPVLGETNDELSGMYFKGTFLVGSQIEAGTYQTQGPTTQHDGTWARLSATTGAPTAVIAHGIVNGPSTIEILPTDAAVQFDGDVVWIKAPAPAPAPTAAPAPAPVVEQAPAPVTATQTTFTAGVYLVGDKIAPGDYETDGPVAGPAGVLPGTWSRLSNTSGELDATIASDIVSGPATMTVSASDHAVKFTGNVTWTKV